LSEPRIRADYSDYTDFVDDFDDLREKWRNLRNLAPKEKGALPCAFFFTIV